MYAELRDRILQGGALTRSEAMEIAAASGADIIDLMAAANRLRERFRGGRADLCSIVNAKSGGCSEDCAFCAQSLKSAAVIQRYPLRDPEEILSAARDAALGGARRFCIVTGGRRITPFEVDAVAKIVSRVRQLGLSPCATLGLLDSHAMTALKAAGLDRYHHNLETSERFFPRICNTHTYADKLKTIESARAAGLSLCSGGIFGVGEDWQDRVDMAFALKALGVDSVPVNYLIPIMGTAMGGAKCLSPLEALKIIALYRFILPRIEIRVCGGRLQTLRELNPLIFMAGADGILIGNYLTTTGRPAAEDLAMLETLGLGH
jgi:biotin synthase